MLIIYLLSQKMYFHLTSSMVDKQVHAKLKTFPSFMSYLRKN